MARIRSIKVDLFLDDALSEVSLAAHLLLAGLPVLADSAGRLEDRPRRIQAELLPYRPEINVGACLDELHAAGAILRYETSGMRCIQVTNWDRDQRPHVKEAPSRLPPPADSTEPGLGGESAGNSPGTRRGKNAGIMGVGFGVLDSGLGASASQRTDESVPAPEGIPGQPGPSVENDLGCPAIARSDTPEPQGSPPFRLEAQKPGKKPRGHRADTPAEALFKALQAMREERCAEVGEPFVPELWTFAQQNQKLRAIAADNPEAQKRFEGGWHEYLAHEVNRHKETAWSLAYFLSAGVRAKYETRAAREEAA